jgi:hypothetical protein
VLETAPPEWVGSGEARCSITQQYGDAFAATLVTGLAARVKRTLTKRGSRGCNKK